MILLEKCIFLEKGKDIKLFLCLMGSFGKKARKVWVESIELQNKEGPSIDGPS